MLSVADRLVLLQILPDKGDYVTLKVLTTLRLNLGLTEEEIKMWGVEHDQASGKVSWEENGIAEIPIGEVATGLIVDALRDLERDKRLPIQAFELYEKFIPTTE